jgi:prepilin signal peptidase PulO-like enzyme (type II secretory pathway)
MSVARAQGNVSVAGPSRAPGDAPIVRGAGLGLPALLPGAILLLAASAFAVLPFDRAIVGAPLGGVLLVLAVGDLERGLIPNRIVVPATVLVLLAQLALFPGQAMDWLLAPTVIAFVLFVPSLLGRGWLGMGDVKLTLLIGAGLGWGVLAAIGIAFLAVFPAALFVIVRGGLAARKSTIPFGPFLALGALVVLFVPHLGL